MRILLLPFTFSLMLVLGGCLSGTDSVSEAKSRENSFPPLSDSGRDFTETSSGDTSNTCGNIQPNELCVTVEVPRRLAGSDPVETRRNLYLVRPESIEASQVSGGLREVRTLDISQRFDDDGAAIIQLNEFESIPTDPDYVLSATLADGTVVRGPLSDADQDVKLNPFSEYLVAETLNGLDSGEIEAIKDCTASNDICLNQLVWPTLVDQIQDFEIDIADDMSLVEAVSYLAGRPDLTDYAASMVAALQTPDDRTSEIDASSVSFNTVYFGLELNRRVLDSGENAGQWGIRRMTTQTIEGNGGSAEIYPNLTLTSFDIFDLDVNSTASDVPFTRRTLAESNTDTFTTLDWETRSHASAPGAAFIQDDLFLQAGRSTFQSVTSENDYLWGWATNPYFYNSYIIRDDNPTALLASYFHSGKALALERSADGTFERRETLEDLAVGTVEINLEQLGIDLDPPYEPQPYDLGALSGDYNAVSFAVRLDDQSENPVEARVQANDWESDWESSSAVAFTETGTSWVIQRTDAGTVTGPATAVPTREIRIKNELDEIYLGPDNTNADAYYGRLDITDGQSGGGIGAALESGGLLAYTFVDDVRGQGIKIAAPETNLADVGGRYLLQGFMLGMTGEINRLAQFNGSELTFTPANDVLLTLAPIQVTHTLATDAVSDPERPRPVDLSGQLTSQPGDNLQFTFNMGMFELNGFATEGGDVLVLAVSDSENKRVGLLLGFKTQ